MTLCCTRLLQALYLSGLGDGKIRQQGYNLWQLGCPGLSLPRVAKGSQTRMMAPT